MSPARLRQPARHLLDHFVARIGNGVDRMPEADDRLLFWPRGARMSASAWSGVSIALLNLEGDSRWRRRVWAAQRADRPVMPE